MIGLMGIEGLKSNCFHRGSLTHVYIYRLNIMAYRKKLKQLASEYTVQESTWTQWPHTPPTHTHRIHACTDKHTMHM